MSTAPQSDTFKVGDRMNRIGYGAMQLAGRGVFGPPKIASRRCPYCAKQLPAG